MSGYLNLVDHMDTSARWRASLRNFLFELLKGIIPKENKRMDLLNDKSMDIWAQAFTDKSVSSKDYERLEYIGDRTLKATFTDYLDVRYPHLSKREYNDMENKYMDNVYQASLTRRLGLDKFIRIGEGFDITHGVAGDVFESFIGALKKTADGVVRGLGHMYCQKMTEYIFAEIELTPTFVGGLSTAPKTQVNQLFTRFWLGDPEAIVPGTEFTIAVKTPLALSTGKILGYGNNNDPKKAEKQALESVATRLIKDGTLEIIRKDPPANAGVTFSIKLTDKQMNLLKEENIKINNPIIASVTAPTKERAESEAYRSALENLAAHGFTSARAEQIQIRRELSDPRLKQYLLAAAPKLKQQGYMVFKFEKPKKTTTATSSVMILEGLRKDGSSEPLGSIQMTNLDRTTEIDYKIQLIEKYIKGH